MKGGRGVRIGVDGDRRMRTMINADAGTWMGDSIEGGENVRHVEAPRNTVDANIDAMPRNRPFGAGTAQREGQLLDDGKDALSSLGLRRQRCSSRTL